MTLLINTQFRKVAIWTSELENYKTQSSFDYSVFIKRFIFEFTDFQLYLFYIGIYQMHLGLLRTNLISLFMVDEFRRVLCESIIPYFTLNKDKISRDIQTKIEKVASEQLQRKVTLSSQTSIETTDAQAKSIQEEIINQEIKELELGEVELFDDYLEMIMTYGYITLFASAFPFGTTITAVFIYIEIRSDVFKLEKLSRRPFSRKTNDIGTWMFALKTLTYGSIFTNLILCGFASDQID